MTTTIDLVADEPTDAPAFGGATRVISENELHGLLAEDARNAPATVAHRAVIRRSTQSEATQSEASAPPPLEAASDTDPWEAPAVATAPPSPEPNRWRRLALLVVPLVVVGALLAAWWTGAL